MFPSTPEHFGGFAGTALQKNEMTPFMPRAPYTAAKLFAYWTVCN
jgi:GDP-D-mannose dehydratase